MKTVTEMLRLKKLYKELRANSNLHGHKAAISHSFGNWLVLSTEELNG